jgi:hypothetical protein
MPNVPDPPSEHIPAPWCPRRQDDNAGWVSGSSGTEHGYQCNACQQGVHCFGLRCTCCNPGPEHTEPVTAGDLSAGDVVVFDDGTEAEITDTRTGDYWLNDGTHAPGVALGWKSGTSSGVMFRQADDVLVRLTG